MIVPFFLQFGRAYLTPEEMLEEFDRLHPTPEDRMKFLAAKYGADIEKVWKEIQEENQKDQATAG